MTTLKDAVEVKEDTTGLNVHVNWFLVILGLCTAFGSSAWYFWNENTERSKEISSLQDTVSKYEKRFESIENTNKKLREQVVELQLQSRETMTKVVWIMEHSESIPPSPPPVKESSNVVEFNLN